MEEKQQEKIVTLRQVLESYQSTRKNLKESTKQEYEYCLCKYLPDWMEKLMSDIDKNMVISRHAALGQNHGPSVANGVMRVLRAMFNHASATFEICDVNPVAHLSRVKAWYPEKRRQTYIKAHQLKVWWNGVQSLESDTMRDFLIFLLFTGLRRNEAASIKWSDIDLDDQTFTIQKTKNGDPLTLPLSNYLIEIFEKRRCLYKCSEYVFPGPGKNGHLVEPKKGVYKVIEKTGIDFTCHDLRRTFLTIAESLDISAYALKRLVNHRSRDVTCGYVIFDVERLRQPVVKIEQYILEKLK